MSERLIKKREIELYYIDARNFLPRTKNMLLVGGKQKNNSLLAVAARGAKIKCKLIHL
jgi:hypothetical protein